MSCDDAKEQFLASTLLKAPNHHKHALLQVQESSESGNKVKSFYRLMDLPVIMVVDPITGAALRTWTGAMESNR